MNPRSGFAFALLMTIPALGSAAGQGAFPAFNDSILAQALDRGADTPAPVVGQPRTLLARYRVDQGPGDIRPLSPPHLTDAQIADLLARMKETDRWSDHATLTDDEMSRLKSVLAGIDQLYVDPILPDRWDAMLKAMGDAADAEYPKNHDWDKTIDDMINAGLKLLKDPFTDYWNPEKNRALMESLNGTFAGIGVRISTAARGVLVDAVFPNSGARSAGLKKGDVILTADGTSLAGMPLENTKQFFQGSDLSPVDLTILRQGERLGPIRVVREEVEIPDLLTKMLNGAVGYLYLSNFDSGSDKHVIDAVRRLRGQGAQSLILDLRGDPGGYVEVTASIASEFLNDGQDIMSFRHQDKMAEDYRASGDGQFAAVPLAVLIDSGSASASEIMAGAMQDLHKNCVVIGSHSYGKGSRQGLVQADGRTLHITKDRNYRPNGQCIDGRHDPADGHPIYGTGGVEPDIVVNVPDEQEARILRRIAEEMYGDVTAPPVEDPALERALEVLGPHRM